VGLGEQSAAAVRPDAVDEYGVAGDLANRLAGCRDCRVVDSRFVE
jgi:hypothetical protein